MINDMKKLYEKFGFFEGEFSEEKLWLRMKLLDEEYKETLGAYLDQNKEEWVDGHIDLIVIALGTLLLAGVDVQKAWDQVINANMAKERGVKKGREDSGGWDIMKPPGWKGPDHSDNYGNLDKAFLGMLSANES